MEYSGIKATIDANIKQNGNQEITGVVLNSVLNAMVTSLGEGYQYKGIVSPSSPAITTDGKVFVVASTAGTYTNYGGLTIAEGEVAILKYGTSWTKEHITYGMTSALREKLVALPTAASISANFAAKLNRPSGAVVGGTIPVFTEDGNGLESTGFSEDYYAPQYLIGDLDELTTEEKDEIVAAINEIVSRIATLAEKDGYYKDMRVGLADNVSGSTATAEEFVSKASDADGFAEIASIKGQSAVVEGEIVSFHGTAIKTIGRNQWDELWEVGGYNNTTGEKQDSSSMRRSVNKFSIMGGRTYYWGGDSSIYFYPFFYAEDGSYISTLDGQRGGTTFATPSNARYMALFAYAQSGVYANLRLCINESDPSFNGQYEPYKESTLTLPELPEGGLRSAGSAYDELTPTKNITRIGVVDLGSLAWSVLTADTGRYFVPLPDVKYSQTFYATDNSLCSHYPTTRNATLGTEQGVGIFCNSETNKQVRVTLTELVGKTAAEVKAAMSGVMLFYELATPIEESVPTRNMVYKTYEGGTESVIPTTMPIKADIIRSVNLPKDFISKASFDKFCTALGTAIGKTITATWDAASRSYNFTIV